MLNERIDLQNESARPPGNLQYTGQFKNEPTRIDIIEYSETEYKESTFHTLEELPTTFKDDRVYWIDVNGLNDSNFLQGFVSRFGIHVLHMEDIVSVDGHARIEVTDNYLMTLHNHMFFEEGILEEEQIAILLLNNIVISFQEIYDDTFEAIRKRLIGKVGFARRLKADYLFYALVDKIVDDNDYVNRSLSFQLDKMEKNFLDTGHIDEKALYTKRKELLTLRTAVFPLDNLLNILLTKGNGLITEDTIPFFRDVEANVDQLIIEISRAKDVTENLLKANEQKNDSELNRVMKNLTIISAMFLPLNFITGMYGMNFIFMPGLKHPHAFWYFLAGTFLLEAILFYTIKKRKLF
ncbi:CorA family divalent cation transporter [Guggenheimella bovis]